MISLIAYFNTESKIYLLLQVANGGRLTDYIASYKPRATHSAPIRLDSLFYDAPNSIHPTEILSQLKHISNQKISQCSNTATILTDLIPPNNVLTQDMDVLDIVNYSKKLLKSVSNTLNESRNIFPKQDADSNNSGTDSTFSCVLAAEKSSNENSNNHKISVLNSNGNGTRYIPESSIRRWASEIVTAISYLHSTDTICMDLHSDNLLLGSNGQIMLSYFYRQKCLQNCSQRQLSIQAIDFLYVAPERPLTKKSDWWSFGVILFELLTGNRFLACHPGGVSSYFEVQYPDVELSANAKDLLQGVSSSIDFKTKLHEVKFAIFFFFLLNES